jgi:phosphoribosylaminoimidazolecarboxamide formyltransferase/IMP cyclohydrolase
MTGDSIIKTALLSVYAKDGLEPVARALHAQGVALYSTGGTRDFLEKLQLPVTAVETLTGYPSILGGRVKTLHPKVFGGILRRDHEPADLEELLKYEIPAFDLVVVDLYPFEETLAGGAEEEDVIEKIDIGGVSLLRAAAKNFSDVLVIPSRRDYAWLLELLNNGGRSSRAQRKAQAQKAFALTSQYDRAIGHWLGGGLRALRYGENPHQQGFFHGDLSQVFEQLSGKELSYNNLLDLDAAVGVVAEFEDPTFAILKHNNCCGAASRNDPAEAWRAALAGDPVSAFGGVIVTNRPVTEAAAAEIDKLFVEILLAPGYEAGVLDKLKARKNRILLKLHSASLPARQVRTALNGLLEQERDDKTETPSGLRCVTKKQPGTGEIADLVFANKLVKHSKSNAIILARGLQLLGSGVGHTSRVDALEFAIAKARRNGLDLAGAVMASDAFFPFPDCVEIAQKAGITAVVQPGGSVRDGDSVAAADRLGLSMVFTGIRHFRH